MHLKEGIRFKLTRQAEQTMKQAAAFWAMVLQAHDEAVAVGKAMLPMPVLSAPGLERD